MSTEAILVTGAVDAMCVDVQCIKQGLVKVAECYKTQLITTNPRCHIEGATHIEFHEHNPTDCTDEVVIKAIYAVQKPQHANRDPQDHAIPGFMAFPMNISITCWAALSGVTIPR